MGLDGIYHMNQIEFLLVPPESQIMRLYDHVINRIDGIRWDL